MTTLHPRHSGGFGRPPRENIGKQDCTYKAHVHNKGGFPSPPKHSNPTPSTQKCFQMSDPPRNRGGFPLPPKKSEFAQTASEQKCERPRGGFGRPPSNLDSLQEASKDVTVKEMHGNHAGRKFAQLSRQVSGYRYSIPEGSRALFAVCPAMSDPVGVIIFTIADETSEQNTLEFQFIHQRFQALGIGKKLVDRALEMIAEKNNKVVYLEAAEQSRKFYQKMGFKEAGDLIKTRGPGASIFRHIYPMTRELTDLVWG